MRQYQTFELTFQGPVQDLAWASVDVTGIFTCGSTEITVKGFYDGEHDGCGIYKVRMFPELAGEWSWNVFGLVNGCGTEDCLPAASGGNESDLHGMVRAKDTHFEFSGGKIFHPFGTTVYALVHQDDSIVEQTMETLSNGYFNKVRMCVFPKHYDFNHNEPPYYAFAKKDPEGEPKDNWNVSRPNIEFWHYFETQITRLREMDIQVDLILFHPYDRWGFSSMTQEDNLLYLDYLEARLSAIPNIWWSLANEYDLNMSVKSLEDWEEIECFTASHDPFHHLLSNHNCFKTWDYARENITHISIQTKDLLGVVKKRMEYNKPACLDECCYEGNIIHFWGSISGKEMTARFWRMVASGCYCTHGETFLNEEEVLWWARGGRLVGKSPARIKFLKDLMHDLPAFDPLPGRLDEFIHMTPEQAEKMAAFAPPEFRSFITAIYRMNDSEWERFLEFEHIWASKSADDSVYLTYLNLQTCSVMDMELPADRKYRIDVIDTWNMTRTTTMTGVSGSIKVELPGEEFYAVLAIAE